MDEQGDKINPLEGLEGWLRNVIREEIRAAMGQNGHKEEDKLFNAEDAAKILSVSKDWLYRNAHKLPFTLRVPPNMLRFSCQGIQKYLATRKTY